MFELVAEKFQNALKVLRGHHRISEINVHDALRDIRKALLEADVNFTVAKNFIQKVKDKAVGEKVIDSVSPGQMITKIIHDEMLALLSMGVKPPSLKGDFHAILMAGLQGSGKTTTCGKLGLWLKNKGLRVLLVAADTQRPAAREQLRVLAKQEDLGFFTMDTSDPVCIVTQALKEAKGAYHRMIVDTAGRLHVDIELMQEISKVQKALEPEEIFFVADAMTGQDAVKTAQVFRDTLPLTGIILTKTDGDARGGAALSMASTIGHGIHFVGTGEKLTQFEPFYPDRLTSRILGMGDIVSLVEKAKAVVDEKEAKKMEEKFRKNALDLDDFLTSLRQMKKMGSFSTLLQMIPGMPKIESKDMDEKQLVYVEAMISSMTAQERKNPMILNGSRRKRISRGSGRPVEEINRLLKQFRDMKLMMKQMNSMMGSRKLPFGFGR
jgi:signal recognition particle subunit SRP54